MITELDKMERAKMYIDKLSEGINPITNTYAPESDTINNERISRCLSYVSEILEAVIENGGKVTRTIRSSAHFYITEEQQKKLHPREEDCKASDIASDINEITSENSTMKILASWINDWLVSIGFIETGEKGKQATEEGEAMGIRTEIRQSIQRGEYSICIFSPEAQSFIIDNIDAIAAYHYTK